MKPRAGAPPDAAGETALETLLKEIAEQPRVVARVLDQQRDRVQRVARLIRDHSPRALVLVARGSSDNASVYGRYLFEVCNRLLTSLAAPSGVTLYESGPNLAETVVIGVSQSGQGADVVTYLRNARAQGATTLAIVNQADSPLAEAAEWVLECLAGPEVSVPATKTVTAQMTLLAVLSAALEAGDGAARSLDPLPSAIERALGLRPVAADLARDLVSCNATAAIGRGFAFPVALETALKLKETSYTLAEPFSAADFLHGPVALVDPSYAAILVDVGGRSTAAALEACEQVARRGGHVALLRAGTAAGSAEVATLAQAAPLDEPYAPILAVVLGQLLAVELALAKGLDPAQPRGLSKVTSTR